MWRATRSHNISRQLVGVGVGAAMALAGCGGGGGTASKQAAPGRSGPAAPSTKQLRAGGIPTSHDDQKEYFKRVYCNGDSDTQCKCKLDSMGANDASTFPAVLYGLQHSDDATITRFGRASTGCA